LSRASFALALHAGQVAVAVEFDQQLAFLDVVAFLHGQAGDLGADVGADIDLGIGLDLARAVDLLDDFRALGRGGFHVLRLVVLALVHHEAAGGDNGHHD